MEIAYYCINLPRAHERRRQIEQLAEQAKLHLRFVEGIEGSTIQADKARGYQRTRRLSYLTDLVPNEFGCIESHRRALQTFLADAADYGVILEDDAEFVTDIHVRLQSLCQSISGFDILKLDLSAKKGFTIGNQDGLEVYAPFKPGVGAIGLLYTRSTAQKVLASLDSYRHPFDTHLGYVCCDQGLRVVAVHPALVWERTGSSLIGARPRRRRLPGIRTWCVDRCEIFHHSVMKRVLALHTMRAIEYHEH